MKKNTNYVLVTCLSLLIVVFSMLSLQQQGFSDDVIPALSINSKGNVGIGVIDSKYNFYVTGNAGFSSTGNVDFISKFGSYGSGDGQFDFSHGITFNSNGDIYIADSHNNRIQTFDSTGMFLSKFGSYGSGDGQFDLPYVIAIHPNGDIYIVDTNNNRIQTFDSTGMFLSKFGSYGSGDGQFNTPKGIAIHPNGDIYVTDYHNNRIQTFDSTGMFLSKFGSAGTGDGQFDLPYGIAIHPNGDIYIVDYQNQRVQIFSPIPVLLVDNGNVGIGTVVPNEALDVFGNILVRDPTNNGAIIISPDNNGYAISPELFIQSAETGLGNDSPFHISRNAYFTTSDNKYHLIDTGDDASRILFDNNGDIIFSNAASGT